MIVTPYLDLQTSSESGPKRNLQSCSFAPPSPNRDRFLVFLLVTTRGLQSRCVVHIIVSRQAHTQRGHKKTQCCSIPQQRAHTRGKSFLCRKQSQLCRVRIGSQSERGGWYDVSPPHRPLVRNRRAKQEAGELKWKWKQRSTSNGSKTYEAIKSIWRALAKSRDPVWCKNKMASKHGDAVLQNTMK